MHVQQVQLIKRDSLLDLEDLPTALATNSSWNSLKFIDTFLDISSGS